MEKEEVLNSAIAGDINAFQTLFAEFQKQLRSYLYRLLADRNDVEDLTHDVFIKAFTKISTFNQESSLKTWVFKIATNLAYDHLRRSKRWQVDAQDRGADLAISSESVRRAFWIVHDNSPAGTYEMREHIDYCFTCISKTLPIENQVALILKDIYDFQIREICLVLAKTEGVVKHLLNDARTTMTTVFEHRCALINKQGVCHQCSHINEIFNPRQNQQEELMKLELVKGSKKYNREELFELRTVLVKAIDPLEAAGTDLHEEIMKCVRTAIGEISGVLGEDSAAGSGDPARGDVVNRRQLGRMDAPISKITLTA
ncbi:RNA polymerase sigma factor [Puia sp. P3]|uniref:RNA polymerase sigma factor n=1 Tax=Puia sp. P3 TaxID=3423952 RepID=UPI003D67D0FD